MNKAETAKRAEKMLQEGIQPGDVAAALGYKTVQGMHGAIRIVNKREEKKFAEILASVDAGKRAKEPLEVSAPQFPDEIDAPDVLQPPDAVEVPDALPAIGDGPDALMPPVRRASCARTIGTRIVHVSYRRDKYLSVRLGAISRDAGKEFYLLLTDSQAIEMAALLTATLDMAGLRPVYSAPAVTTDEAL